MATNSSFSADRVVKCESGRKPSDSRTYDRNLLSIRVPFQDQLLPKVNRASTNLMPTGLQSSTLVCSDLFVPPFSCFVRFGPLTGHLLGGDVEAVPDIRHGNPEN
jgi:hypothetical protein